MSEYNGRRAPNFSQYLDDLNAIPSPYDQALQQQQQQQDSFNLDSELSLFTNAEFFDFDKLGDLNLPTFDSVDDDKSKANTSNTEQNSDLKFFDFDKLGDLNLPTFDSVDDDKSKANTSNTEQNSDLKFLDFLNDGLGNMNSELPSTDLNSTAANNQSAPVQNTQFGNAPTASAGLPSLNTTNLPAQASPQSASSAQTPTSNPKPAPKRKSSHKPSPISVEEAARHTAEEDKRRRNTAASARFRVKKKVREQTLEKTVKDTNDKNAALEARVTALELENQWLKNLITEKNGRNPDEGKTSQNDIASMFKKFLATQKQLNSARASS